MAKQYKVFDPSEPGTSGSQYLTTDWSQCVLCQEDTPEMLKCPVDSTCHMEGEGYKTIAEYLEAFDKIGCLPRTLNLSRLDEGEGIEAAFRLQMA